MLSYNDSRSHAPDIEPLYDAYRQPLMRYLARLVGDRDLAEDLLQETFVKALRAWDSFVDRRDAGPWLFRIARNTAFDYLRRHRDVRFSPLDDTTLAHDADTSGPEASTVDEHETVREALAQLPELYRTPLVLFACGGHSTSEIAATLGCRHGAVRTRLYRARQQFRQIYRPAA